MFLQENFDSFFVAGNLFRNERFRNVNVTNQSWIKIGIYNLQNKYV